MLSPQKSTSVAVLLAATLILSIAPAAFAADSAPDWLRAAAQEKLPDYDKDAVAVVLLDEVQNTVRPNGDVDVRHRAAVRLLRPEARRGYGSISVPFDKDTKIDSLKAWTIESNGREISVGEKDAIEHGFLSYFEYDDTKVKALSFPEANPGNVVGFEYVQRKRPYVFEDSWEFQDEVPVKTARFILDLPAGWEFSTTWFNHPDEKPQNGANQYTWELHDLAAVDLEAGMPPWRTVAGWVGVKYFPSDPKLRAKSSGSWRDIGVWYGGLTESSRVASPQIKQKAAELTTGISDPLQKIRTLTEYVQKNIRYMAVEIGIGGFQPHPASEVFAHQFGDCKDKATLLSSMLHEIGIESYYMAVDTNRGWLHPSYPSVSMNHMILAIQVPDAIPDGALWTVVHDPKLGRLLIFDPTNEYVPLGYLPSYLQASYGLVMGPDGGQLVSTPLLPPATNRMLRTAKFTVAPAGDLVGEVQELDWGAPASSEREEFLKALPAKRQEIFDRFLANFLNNFKLTGASLANLEKSDQVLSLNYKFVSTGYASPSGDLLILRPRVLGDNYTYLLNLFTEKKPRKYPIQFDEATRQDDLFDITLPPGYVVDGLPGPTQAENDIVSYHSDMKVDGDVLHYKRTFEIKAVNVPTEKLSQMKEFLQQVAADQESAVILRRSNPQ